jgi:hypothetical protein
MDTGENRETKQFDYDNPMSSWEVATIDTDAIRIKPMTIEDLMAVYSGIYDLNAPYPPAQVVKRSR